MFVGFAYKSKVLGDPDAELSAQKSAMANACQMYKDLKAEVQNGATDTSWNEFWLRLNDRVRAEMQVILDNCAPALVKTAQRYGEILVEHKVEKATRKLKAIARGGANGTSWAADYQMPAGPEADANTIFEHASKGLFKIKSEDFEAAIANLNTAVYDLKSHVFDRTTT